MDTSLNLDLLIVNPSGRKKIYGDLDSSLHGLEPPLWSGLLAGFIRDNNYRVKIIDAEAENLSPEETAAKILKEKPILAAIIVSGSNPSASTTNMTAAGDILKSLKKRSSNIPTIVGGLHPSALPERTLREEAADFVCRGEGFYTIRDLLKILKEGRDPGAVPVPGLWYLKDQAVISNPEAPLVQNLDSLPFAAWDLLPMEKYRSHNWHCFEAIDERQPYAVIYTSLGCPFNCKFCCIQALYGGPGIRFRSPERVVEEIGYLVKNYKVKNIKFIDEIFVLKEDRVKKICDLIIRAGYRLNIWCYARVDTVKEALLKKMKEAGINWVAYGIESASSKVRQGVAKRVVQERIKKAVEMTNRAGIYIIGNFIFGLPDDTLETMEETFNMAKEFNFEFVNFYTAMAYPGSALYEEALAQGVRLPAVWHGYAQYAEETLPLPTKYLSPAEVLRFRDRAFREYFSRPEYLSLMGKKFGPKAVEHIREMLSYQLKRRYA